MFNVIKKTLWRLQFKSHNKIKKRLITDIETTDLNVNNRERITDRKEHLQTVEILLFLFNLEPISFFILLGSFSFLSFFSVLESLFKSF